MKPFRELDADLGEIENLFSDMIKEKPETYWNKKQAEDFKQQIKGFLDKIADLYGEIEEWLQEKDEE